MKGIALHNARAGQRRRPSNGLRKEAVLQRLTSSARSASAQKEQVTTPVRGITPRNERGIPVALGDADRSGMSAGKLFDSACILTHVRFSARY